MTITGGVRAGATTIAMVVGILLAIVLPRFLPLTWALPIAGAVAAVLYLALSVLYVGSFERRFYSNDGERRTRGGGKADADAEPRPSAADDSTSR